MAGPAMAIEIANVGGSGWVRVPAVGGLLLHVLYFSAILFLEAKHTRRVVADARAERPVSL
jgi:hypothetical protein